MSPPSGPGRGGGSKKGNDGQKVLASNRAAHHHFSIDERFEAGMALTGTEVKSLRDGRANLSDSFAGVKNNEIYLYNCHISPYSHGNLQNHEPLRTRKLLLRKNEIRSLIGKTTLRGFTIVPLRIYLKGSHIKIEIALAKGKLLHDKREAERRKDDDREARMAIKERRNQ